MLVGNAGILVTKVLYTKHSEAKHFIIIDAGMNDLARPASTAPTMGSARWCSSPGPW